MVTHCTEENVELNENQVRRITNLVIAHVSRSASFERFEKESRSEKESEKAVAIKTRVPEALSDGRAVLRMPYFYRHLNRTMKNATSQLASMTTKLVKAGFDAERAVQIVEKLSAKGFKPEAVWEAGAGTLKTFEERGTDAQKKAVNQLLQAVETRREADAAETGATIEHSLGLVLWLEEHKHADAGIDFAQAFQNVSEARRLLKGDTGSFFKATLTRGSSVENAVGLLRTAVENGLSEDEIVRLTRKGIVESEKELQEIAREKNEAKTGIGLAEYAELRRRYGEDLKRYAPHAASGEQVAAAAANARKNGVSAKQFADAFLQATQSKPGTPFQEFLELTSNFHPDETVNLIKDGIKPTREENKRLTALEPKAPTRNKAQILQALRYYGFANPGDAGILALLRAEAKGVPQHFMWRMIKTGVLNPRTATAAHYAFHNAVEEEYAGVTHAALRELFPQTTSTQKAVAALKLREALARQFGEDSTEVTKAILGVYDKNVAKLTQPNALRAALKKNDAFVLKVADALQASGSNRIAQNWLQYAQNEQTAPFATIQTTRRKTTAQMPATPSTTPRSAEPPREINVDGLVPTDLVTPANILLDLLVGPTKSEKVRGHVGRETEQLMKEVNARLQQRGIPLDAGTSAVHFLVQHGVLGYFGHTNRIISYQGQDAKTQTGRTIHEHVTRLLTRR